jgi:basic membrane protein A
VVWVNEWFNPPKETEAATALINGGADVLFQNTDSSAVLQTAEKMGKRAFGWDSDMTAYGPKAHLGSAVINWGAVLHQGRGRRAGRHGPPARPGGA